MRFERLNLRSGKYDAGWENSVATDRTLTPSGQYQLSLDNGLPVLIERGSLLLSSPDASASANGMSNDDTPLSAQSVYLPKKGGCLSKKTAYIVPASENTLMPSVEPEPTSTTSVLPESTHQTHFTVPSVEPRPDYPFPGSTTIVPIIIGAGVVVAVTLSVGIVVAVAVCKYHKLARERQRDSETGLHEFLAGGKGNKVTVNPMYINPSDIDQNAQDEPEEQ